MPKEKMKIRNHLYLARMRLRLSRKYVSRLLGQRGVASLASYEQGKCCPSLLTALKLEIIYRQPIAFLWPDLYAELRHQIRQDEEQAVKRREKSYVR